MDILFEDSDLFVINKPPGLVVNRAESVKGETVQDWIENNAKCQMPNAKLEEHQDFIGRSGIVHRIDKETSGCLVIAKRPTVFYELQRQFKDREIKKTYLAIVHGVMPSETGEIRAPVGRLPWNRERFGIVPGGKDAVTRYSLVSRITYHVSQKQDAVLSLVELFPETGRTHQIRVHLKYINHPIVGDYLYAGRKTARDDRRWAPRVMLHAWKIAFSHPSTGESLAIEAPIPEDMNKIINFKSQ